MAKKQFEPNEKPIKGNDDFSKGNDSAHGNFEKHDRQRGELSEGYQPIRDVTSEPPGGGSGVPDKSNDD